MGILSRFADIISSNINDLLDRAEDPEKMAKQYLIDAKKDLAEVKQETAQVMADEARCKRNVEKAQADVDKYMNLAKKAVAAGNDADATVFLNEKNKAAQILATAQTAYQAAKSNADKMLQLHNKLAQDVSSLQDRLDNVKTMSSVARAQQTVAKMTSKDYGSAMSKFDAMEERVQSQLDASSASMELNTAPVNEADALAAKYGGGAGADVSGELAALKAEMGMSSPDGVSVADELAALKAEQ